MSTLLHLNLVPVEGYVPPDQRQHALADEEPCEFIDDVFVPLPSHYNDDWPLSTQLRCWHCDLTFASRPRCIPKYEGGAIAARGVFCTFACAAAYILSSSEYAATLARWAAQADLWRLYSTEVVPLHPAGHLVPPAPDKHRMRFYGGDLDPAEWRRLLPRETPITAADSVSADSVSAENIDE